MAAYKCCCFQFQSVRKWHHFRQKLSQRRNTLSLEQENFTRCGKALIGTGTKILQEILESYIPSKDIFSKLTSTTHPDLWKKRLNPQQKALIGKAVTDGYTNFDITLCYTLLRNLNVNAYVPFKPPFPKPTRGWGNQPLATDTTQSDDIERIRILRNEMYGHLARPSIPNIQFADVWGQLKDLCTRMKGHYPKGTDFEKEFSALESFKFNRIQWDSIVHLVQNSRDQEEAIADHTKSIAEHTKRLDSLEVKHSILDQNLQSMSIDQNRHDKKIEDHDKKIDELDKTIDDHEKKIDEHDQKVDEHGKKIIEHSSVIKEEGKKIDQQGIKIEEHDNVIDEHSKAIDEHGKSIHSHGKMIDQYGQTIIEHGQTIDEHYEMIDDHDQKIDALDVQYQNQQAELLNINEKLKTNRTETEKFDLDKLHQRLIRMNHASTRVVQLSPVQERGEKELPIEMLYASVVILEDYTYAEKGKGSPQNIGTSEVTDPGDIFINNGELVNRIYMSGDAAHGKTTYSLWLLKKWCDAVNIKTECRGELDMWEKVMKEYQFVFLVQFRYVNPNLASVVDMICEDVFMGSEECHSTIRHVLSSDKYKSLIIMDGLDEWNPNEDTRKQLTRQEMPNIPVSSTVSCFIAMRPWMFALISKMVTINDRVIKILGLSEKGMEKVVENVLLNYYNLRENVKLFKTTRDRIAKHLQEKSIKSFMKIPLLAVVCVQIWIEEKQFGDSMTSFFAAMLNMLIERAYEKHKLEAISDSTVDHRLPDVLSEHDHIENYISVLLKLGKVAYDGLLSDKTNLVFQKRKLEKEIGKKDLQFALDVGLISQKEAPSLFTKNLSVHFFHKSIQEFLAVIYIESTKEVGDSFCKHLSNIKEIMEFSNVIMFICGMYPSLGSFISRHVVNVTDKDPGILENRQLPYGGNSTIREMYKIQVSWLRELKYSQMDNQVPFHVSDVYLADSRRNGTNDIDTVRMTRELLSDHNVDMKTLLVYRISTDREHGISNKELNEFLCNKHKNTGSLETIRINGTFQDRSIDQICIPSVRNLFLHTVKINETVLDAYPFLINMTSLSILELSSSMIGDRELGLAHLTSLKQLRLYSMTLPDLALNLSAEMQKINRVRLHKIYASATGWQQFMISVLNIKHRFKVELESTNIDDESKTKIRSSTDFKVTKDFADKDVLYFVKLQRNIKQ
ncbi:hypothetical protein FSP39_003128 [Pinctada imbricata]|uniref:NACHT domain-containing protein n=1 Tax=Pinctada imbricata TaxID=66713 RepID=A0AA89BIM7_PINIB|nr:hypothetical protein FSP39_003128 [Pinctada imbricata]